MQDAKENLMLMDMLLTLKSWLVNLRREKQKVCSVRRQRKPAVSILGPKSEIKSKFLKTIPNLT